jgi:histidine triad (HIT) family protein
VTAASVVWDDDCDFCTIARGDEPSADVLCEGETWLAFFPLAPATAGHTLVIPRRHVTDLWSVDRELAADLIHAVISVGRAIETVLTPAGMNVITSSGEAAEQTIYHLHLHVVPRYRDDDFGPIWPAKEKLKGVDLDAIADRIRKECRASARADYDQDEKRRDRKQ